MKIENLLGYLPVSTPKREEDLEMNLCFLGIFQQILGETWTNNLSKQNIDAMLKGYIESKEFDLDKMELKLLDLEEFINFNNNPLERTLKNEGLNELLIQNEQLKTEKNIAEVQAVKLQFEKPQVEKIQTEGHQVEKPQVEKIQTEKHQVEKPQLEKAYFQKQEPIFSVKKENYIQNSSQQTVNKKIQEGLFYRSKVAHSKEYEVKETKEVVNIANEPTNITFKENSFFQGEYITPNSNLQRLYETSATMFQKDFLVVKKGEKISTQIKLYPEELGEVNVQLVLEKGVLNIRLGATTELGYNYLKENGQELQQRFVDNSFDFNEVNLQFYLSGDLNGNNGRDSRNNQYLPKSNFSLQDDGEDFHGQIEIEDLVKTTYNYKV